jgi:hypothetical protein
MISAVMFSLIRLVAGTTSGQTANRILKGEGEEKLAYFSA